MSSSRTGPEDNLPASLRLQLEAAAQQSRGTSCQGVGQNHHRQEQHYYRPPQRNVSHHRGGPPSLPPTGPTGRGHSGQRSHLSFRPSRGRAPPGFHPQNSPFADHPRHGGSPGPHFSEDLAPGPQFVTHQTSRYGPTASEKTFTVSSDTSSFIPVLPDSERQLPLSAGVDSKEAPGPEAAHHQISNSQNAANPLHTFTSASTSSDSSRIYSCTYPQQSDFTSASSFSDTSHLIQQHLSQSTSAPQYPKPFRPPDPMDVEVAPGFRERAARGSYRGARHGAYNPQSHRSQDGFAGFMTDQNAPVQSFVPARHAYNHRTGRALWDPNTHLPQDVERQCMFLRYLAEREANNSVSEKELLEKESFRKKLERIVQQLFVQCSQNKVINFDPRKVKLKCYGSLASGFAVPSSDMDLLLVFPGVQGPVGCIETESRRMIEKDFLDRGYGARLLTKTRVPILRVCQSPTPELLANLRVEREKWDGEAEEEGKESLLRSAGLDPGRLPSTPTTQQSDAATVTFAELDTEPSIMPLPPSPARVHADLDFKNDVGIQCDINFSNYVAIHNTALLRCYCKCDPRVRPMGLFVKEWSKARKINTPYYGTLSSYGYIMMVLHYLMNIAQPPVIPNLQHLAKDEDAWNNKTDIELFEGFDIRFISDEELLENRARAGQVTQNRETLGSLLRGFFRYYSDSRGFHWLNQVISIRTQGGVLTKLSKDWTQTRRAGTSNNVVLRYILAVEDPFEIDHNIARTVCHSGVRAIRFEFSRAWQILSTVNFTQGRWFWYRHDGREGEDLLSQAEDRGDLLRKDQEEFRDKFRKQRAEERNLEAKSNLGGHGNGHPSPSVNGMSSLLSRSRLHESDGNVARTHPRPAGSTLIKPGRGGQKPRNGKSTIPLKKTLLASDERENKAFQNDLARIQNESKVEGHPISKWIQSATAGAAEKKTGTHEDKKQAPVATVNGSAGPLTKRETTSNDVSSPRKLVLASSSNETNAEQIVQGTMLSPMIDPNKPLSAWDLQTPTGRWLNWRDNRILAGNRDDSVNPEFQGLHRLHPFDPARPPASTGGYRNAATLRAKRLRYFTAKLGENGRASTTENHDENQEQEGKDLAIATVKAKPSIGEIPSSCSGRECEISTGQDQDCLENAKKVPEEVSNSGYTLALSSNNPEVVHGPESEPALSQKAPPARFDDGGVHDYRADPPIRSVPKFHFDAAQLRDLEKIAKGGNGCVRHGQDQ